MTKRREHWTDELIEAVRHAPRQRILTDEQVYAVIATMDDWQKQNRAGRTTGPPYWVEQFDPYVAPMTDLGQYELETTGWRLTCRLCGWQLLCDPLQAAIIAKGHVCKDAFRGEDE